MRTVAFLLVLLPLLAACAGLVWVIVRARAHPPAPPRPEQVRARFERLEHRSTAERVVSWMLLMPFLLPPVLLVALAGDPRARFAGAALLGAAVLARALTFATGRSGKVETVRARALARSEAFWSQPDAEE